MRPNTENKRLFQAAIFKRQRGLLSRRVAQAEKKRIGYGAMTLWIIFIGILFYSLFFSPWLSITTTEIIGESIISRSTLEAFLRENISGKKFFIVSRNQMLVIRESEIQRLWIERFPKFESVRLERSFPHTIRLEVKESPILIRWCSGGPCVLLDERGRTRDDRHVDEPAYMPYLYTIVDKSATPVEVGESLEISSYIRTLHILVENLLSVTALRIDPAVETPTRHARELRVRTSEGWDILLNTEAFSRETLERLNRLLREKIPEEKRARLMSIDLRTEEKAFIAYRDIPAIIEEEALPETQKAEVKKESKKKKD